MIKFIFFFSLIFLGCKSKTKEPAIKISLVDSNKHLQISGLNYAILQDINRDTTANIWQNLFQIYRMPADTDLKDYQPAQPGKYIVKDSLVVFVPDTAFRPHQTYFIRYYEYDKGSTAWDYIKNHQKPGKKQYHDLMFRQ